MNYNQYFILNYGYDSWYYKMRLLEFLIENYEHLKGLQYFPEINESVKEGQKPIESEVVVKALKVEYFASTLHITESLFALMWAFEKNINQLWKLLATYRNEVDTYARDTADGKNFSDDEINKIFYAKANLQKAQEIEPQRYEEFIKSFEKIKVYVSNLAKWFIQHRPFYNSYKHGLRYIRAVITPKIIPEKLSKYMNEKELDAVIFPRLNEKVVEGIEPCIAIISYERLKVIHKMNYDLIGNMIFTLRQRYKIQSGEKLSQVQVRMFDKSNLNDLFPLIETSINVKFEDMK